MPNGSGSIATYQQILAGTVQPGQLLPTNVPLGFDPNIGEIPLTSSTISPSLIFDDLFDGLPFLPGTGAPTLPGDLGGFGGFLPPILDLIGGFLPGGQQPDVSVDFPGSGIPTQRFPTMAGQVRMVNGKCVITQVYPGPRVVNRRARIVGCGPNGQPICTPASRRMNALNPHALGRALRRAKAFAKFARKSVKITTTFKGRARGFGGTSKAKKKRGGVACPQ